MRTLQDLRHALLKRWWKITIPSRLARRGVRAGAQSVFYGMPLVSRVSDSSISVGDRAILVSHGAFTALGICRPCVLRTLRPGASISIGDDTGISGGVICAARAVTIGKRCLIGADVKIVDTDFHAVRAQDRYRNNNPEDVASAPVTIGDDVFVGTGAVILKGVTIGTGSIIGAGSVVAKDVPDFSIAAGNPATVVRSIPRESSAGPV